VSTPMNPKKRSLMPSSPLRRQLRAAGHHLSPVVQVGKEGMTEAVLRQLDGALVDHELVKVKMGTETPEDRFEAADALVAGAEGAQLAQILGRTLLVYRRHPEKPRYEPLPPAARPPNPTRAERQARAAQEARTRRTERPRRTTRAERTTRPTRPDRTKRTTRPERSTRTARADRPKRATRPGRPPRGRG